MNKKHLIILLTVIALWRPDMCIYAAEKLPSTYNPKPRQGDVILPMPNGMKMVFLKIVVPGKNFWGSPERIIQLGDAEGGIFEGLQRVQINGSFYDKTNNNWFYLLGKYEVTKGQFAAVMGLDELINVSGDSTENTKLKQLSGQKLEKALAKPLAFVSWHAIQNFLYQYNLWLFDENHPDRLSQLPKFKGAPGFIRLPTEIEWEFAARGGYGAQQDGSFKNKLPFPAAKLVKYAWFLRNAKHRARPIGLRLPNPLGLHDVFGNVQELTSDIFRPEIWQGKPGGLVARGGSVATKGINLRSSYREEVEIYKWDEDDKRTKEWRSYNTGTRLAIGSNVVVNTGNRVALEKEYTRYQNDIRTNMPVGRTLDNPVAQAATQLSDAHETLVGIMKRNPTLKTELSHIQRFIEDAEQKLDRAQRESVRSMAQDALRGAADLGRDIFKIESLRKQKVKAEKLADISTRYQGILTTIKVEIERRDGHIKQLLMRYGEDVGTLGEYSPAYISQAFKVLGEKKLTKRAKVALDLLMKHVSAYKKMRRIDMENWRRDFNQTFKELAD